MVQDARKFQYSSDYPQPLVTYRAQFTLTPSQSVQLFRFPHNLPYTPLILVKASLNSDFSTSGDPWTGANLGICDAMECIADDTYIYVVLFATTQNLRTNYIRVLGFAPPDYDGDMITISNDSVFRFNSDYDYAGCISGVLNPGDLYEVTHNLGYAPQCRRWNYTEITLTEYGIDISGYHESTDSGIGYPINTGKKTMTNISTPQKIIMSYREGEEERVGSKVYYHIYTMEG